MLSANSIASTLGTYLPTVESVRSWAAPNYDWIKNAPSFYGSTQVSTAAYQAVGYVYGSTLSCIENFNLAETAWGRANTMISPDRLLALISVVNGLSCADRVLECVTDVTVGLGRHGAAINGLAACAMLAAYAKEGDLLGMGISAGKLSAIAAFGSNPGVDAVADFLCARYASYRNPHSQNPANAANGQGQLNQANAANGQGQLNQANAANGPGQLNQANAAVLQNVMNQFHAMNGHHPLTYASWIHTHVGTNSSGAQDEPARPTAPQL